MKKKLSVALVVFVSATMAACTANSGPTVSANEARTIQNTRPGVVVHVRNVTIEGDSGRTGMVVGGVSGAVLGSQIGGGSGRVFGGVAGALAGGAAGNAIERNMSRTPGLEITVRMDDNNREVVIVQEANQSFAPGDRVTVVTNGNQARVTR